MADCSITASGEVRLEARAQEPHVPPVEPPPVPVVVPDDQPNEPQEREEPEEPEPERRNRNRCGPALPERLELLERRQPGVAVEQFRLIGEDLMVDER